MLPIVRQCNYCEATATDSVATLDVDTPGAAVLQWVAVCDEHWRGDVTA